MDVEGSFGFWVKGRRKALGLTQRGLAYHIGCSISIIQKIERDERRPSLAIAELLAHHLEVDDADYPAFLRFARVRTHEEQTLHSDRTDNLPAPVTTLVGREWELQMLSALLLRDDVRLLTISGPPGIGKSRLALQAARHALDRFADGSCFVALAPLADASYVMTAIARALGAGEVERQLPLDRLKSYLRRKRLLLLLDNFEHVLAAAGEVAELLESAPDLKILATSRALLQIYGEHEFVVPPLAVPDLAHLSAQANLTRYAAVELFVQRARAAKFDFALSEQNARYVAELCVRLDGLPLAIELAAARIKQLTPEVLLARLAGTHAPGTSNQEVLAGRWRNLPARQQTLHAAIEWSYNLLTPVEQRVFRVLGVFAGGCTLAALTAVNSMPAKTYADEIGESRRPATANWLEATVLSLVNKSLVGIQPGRRGEPRYVLLEVIREYALHKLELHGERAAICRAHAACFLALGACADITTLGAGNQTWPAIQYELDNLRAALGWALEHDAAQGLLLAVALADNWNKCGLEESRSWLEQMLAAVTPEYSRRYAHAARTLGTCLWLQGEYVMAQAWLEKSVTCWYSLDDGRELGIAQQFLALVLYNRDDYEAALAPVEQAVLLLRQSRDSGWLAVALNTLGITYSALGDYSAADLALEESLALFRAQGSDWGIALDLSAKAEIPYAAGDYRAACDLLEKALRIFRRAEERWFVTQILWQLGKALWHLDETTRAVAAWEEAATMGREIDAKEYVAGSLLHLGYAALDVGATSRAYLYFSESLAIYRQMQQSVGIGYALGGLAGAAGLCTGADHRCLVAAQQALNCSAGLVAGRRKLLDDLERAAYAKTYASLHSLMAVGCVAVADEESDLDNLLRNLAFVAR